MIFLSFGKMKKQADDIPKSSVRTKTKDLRTNLKDILKQIADNDISGRFEILSVLKEVELENITVNLQEDDAPNKPMGVFNLFLVKSGNDLTGRLKAILPPVNDLEGKIDTGIVYRQKQEDLTISAQVDNLQPDYLDLILTSENDFSAQDMVLNGEFQAAFNSDFRLSLALFDFFIPSGTLAFPAIFPEPITIENGSLKAYFNRDKNDIIIEELSGTVDGIQANISAEGILKEDSIFMPIFIEVPQAQMSDISKLVPDPQSSASPEAWLKNKLSKGVISDITVSADLQLQRDAQTKKITRNIDNMSAAFDFSGMTVQYSDTLKPATDASGSGSYKDDKFVVTAQSAKIENIIGSNIRVDMEGMSIVGGGTADITLNAKGPLPAVLDYISDEPIGMGDALGFKPSETKGNAVADVRIQFPTVKGVRAKDFKVTVDGKITDALVPNVVQGLPLTGGPFDLNLKGGIVTLKGAGQLAQRPIDLTFMQNTNTVKDYEMKVTASLTADEGLRQSFGADLSEFLTGPVPIKLDYVDSGKTSTANITGTLDQAVLSVNSVGFVKPAGVAGSVNLTAKINGQTLAEVNSLNVTTTGLSLKNGQIFFGKNAQGKLDITRGSVENITLGKSKLAASFEKTPTNILKVIAKGPVFDAVPFLAGDKSSATTIKTTPTNATATVKQVGEQQISLTTDTMLMKEDIEAKNVILYLGTNNAGKISRFEMDAIIGKGKVVVRLKPDAATAQKSLLVESADAGKLLKAIGIYNNVNGGFLTINGKSKANSIQDIAGTMRLDNFKVTNAPVLAKLINTLSLPGILGLLSNEGLSFSRLESKFEWRYDERGDMFIVKEGRTSGASLGLTYEGLIDRRIGETDISGTVVPMSEVNNIIGGIPIIGDLLTGGGALVAATYSIKGPTENPRVFVNPLSVLAPGFIRKILFEENVETKIKDAEKKQ